MILTDLPDNYSTYKANYTRCALNYEDNWSEEEIDYFKELNSQIDLYYVNDMSKSNYTYKNQINQIENIYLIDAYYL